MELLSGIQLGLISLFLIYWVFSQLLPYVLACIIQFKYGCSVTIGKIGLPNFAIHNIRVKINDLSVIIGRLRFTSSLVNSDAPKLLSVIVTTLKITKLPSSSSSSSYYSSNNEPSSPSPSRNRGGRQKLKAPTIVSNLVQFLGIHINELHIWSWEAVDEKKGVHTNIRAEHVSVDGCTTVGGANIRACVVLNLGTVEARISENWLPTSEDLRVDSIENNNYFNGKSGNTLLEFVFDFRLTLLFGPKNSDGFIENFNIDVENLLIKWELKEKSISLFNSLLRWEKPQVSEGRNDKSMVDWIEEIVLTQCVPKEFKFRIYETECRISDVPTKTSFSSVVSGFAFTSRCIVYPVEGTDGFDFESQFDLGLIKIEPDSHQSFCVDQFSNYINLSPKSLTLNFDITNLGFKSYERSLQFAKTIMKSKSSLTTQLPRPPIILKEVIRSFQVEFEAEELDIQWNDRAGKLCSAYIEMDCRDIRRIQDEGTCSFEVEMKKVNTTFKYSDDWHRPIAFDFLVVNLREQCLGAKFCGSRIQWIPPLENEILNFVCSLLPSRKQSRKHTRRRLFSCIKRVNLEVSDSKVTYVDDNDLCFNMDMEVIFLSRTKKETVLNIQGFEVFSSSNFSDCTLNPLVMMPKCDYSLKKVEDTRRNEFLFSSDSTLYWAPFLHVQMTQFYRKIQHIRGVLMPDSQTEVREDKPVIPSVVSFKFLKTFKIIAKLAKNHAVEIIADRWNVERGSESFDWSVKCLNVNFDGVPIMQWDQFDLCKGSSQQKLTKSYRRSAGLTQKRNTDWYWEIENVSFTFPYGYNFASSFNEEFVSCFKWIRKLHAKAVPDLPTLWSDVVIKIQAIRIEVGDDPFEVKLRDNYELLEDEYYESLKRYQLLENKLNQRRQTIGVSSSKVDELRSKLVEQNSGVYIQRSKQLYQNHPMRTHLLLWELSAVQIIAMADPSIFGKENVTAIMKDVDSDSPWPQEDLDFTTLWCRFIRVDVSLWRVQLRDFPQPLMDSSNLHFWGKLAAAEVMPTKRSKRTSEIQIGGPFAPDYVERSLNGLKWYYDLNCDIDAWSVAFGPCWEPVLAQCSLSLENIIPPSRDPSKPLPFWDKIRLNFHGRLYAAVKTLTHLLHASLNPYNTTEEMEVTWTDAAVAWTNGKIIFEGDLNVYVRTASKYDDCRMLHLPSVRLTFKLSWICLGDANDHHAVTPCAPDKLPEYSSNQEHDSFRAFRSENLNMSLSLETRSKTMNASLPTAVLYGSTLRWFENLKFILSGTTRPTKRGAVFHNIRPKKIPISRHYRKIRLSVSLNRFHVCYWVSFSMQSGIELFSGKLSSSSEHLLQLQPINDGLIHRPKAEWSVLYMNCEVNETEIWLQSAIQQEMNEMNFSKPIEKFFFMSIEKLSYGREALLSAAPAEHSTEPNQNDTPHHRLVVHELKGAWTSSNRDVAFALLDSFVKVQQLKRNLSTVALKGFFGKDDAPSGSPVKSGKGNNNSGDKKSRLGEVTSTSSAMPSPRPSPLSGLQGQNAAASLLQKLISEAESRGVVFSEDLTLPPPQQSLHGVAQCSLDDVILHKWLIELINCQVLLKGCETSGYVIVSAAKAHILQREHKPVWKHGTIVPKTTWVGALEGMQYYATVSAGNNDTVDENIQWLSVENIEERDSSTVSSTPDMVGSGQSVGGVVSETVGESADELEVPVQLQRIVSRCKCEFFYTTYGETGVDKIPSGIPDIPPAPKDLELWDEINKPVEAFTLMHNDLNVFTNSLQYAMVMDIVNNLVLYMDPKRKETFEKLQTLRFKLQLESVETQREPIQDLQNNLRSLISQLRRLEKETYLVTKELQENSEKEALNVELKALEQQVNECKEQIAAKGEELHMMILCYKETKLAASQRLSRKQNNNDIYPVRVYEICFKHAQWRLTQTDGQLGIADLVLSNFLYTKTDKSDDTTEHLCELGYITVTNLLPNQMYKDVLVPSHIHASMPVDRQRTLRVFCRDRPPVGGIGVKEHFEINIAPITIGMTYQLYKTLFKFCFPEKDPEKLEDQDVDIQAGGDMAETMSLGGLSQRTYSDSPAPSISSYNASHISSSSTASISTPTSKLGRKNKVKRKESKFYVAMNSEKDDVEKMKERAEKNMLFICVKVPEVPVRVSYKGEKDKNIEDVQDVHVLIPTLEYNNITWTWLDFLLAVRNHSRRVLLSQAIKQKLWKKSIISDANNSPQEEDKAKMLLGAAGDAKGLKRTLFGQSKSK